MDKQHIVIYHIDQKQEAMAASILMTEQELILHYARTSDEVQAYGTRYSITAVIMECDLSLIHISPTQRMHFFSISSLP